LQTFVEYVTNNLDGLTYRAPYNLFTQTHSADLVNLVHIAINNFMHNQLMSPGTVVPVPHFAMEFMKQVKRRELDWQKLLPSCIALALQPVDTSTMFFLCKLCPSCCYEPVNTLINDRIFCRPTCCASTSTLAGPDWPCYQH
jgi:hypothetical protein